MPWLPADSLPAHAVRITGKKKFQSVYLFSLEARFKNVKNSFENDESKSHKISDILCKKSCKRIHLPD